MEEASHKTRKLCQTLKIVIQFGKSCFLKKWENRDEGRIGNTGLEYMVWTNVFREKKYEAYTVNKHTIPLKRDDAWSYDFSRLKKFKENPIEGTILGVLLVYRYWKLPQGSPGTFQ